MTESTGLEEDVPEVRGREFSDELLEVLLDGLDFCLKTFVGSDNIISTDGVKRDEPGLFMSIITFGYKPTPKDETFFKNHEDVGRAILNDLSTQLDAFSTCWSMDVDFDKCVDFNDVGCKAYDMEAMKAYINKIDTEHMPKINNKIIKIIRPFGKRFMKKLMDELLKYWILCFDKCKVEVNPKATKGLRTIVGSAKVDEHTVRLEHESRGGAVQPEQDRPDPRHQRNQQRAPEEGAEVRVQEGRCQPMYCSLTVVSAIRESRIMFFIFNYLKYIKMDYTVARETRKSLYLEIWNQSLNLLKYRSLSPQKLLRVHPHLHLVLDRRDLRPAGHQVQHRGTPPDYHQGLLEEIPSDFNRMFVDELSYIANCAIGRLSINYGEMFSSGNFTVTPIPPTIFHYYGKVKFHKSALNDQKLLISRL
jgi:hypothetical protein